MSGYSFDSLSINSSKSKKRKLNSTSSTSSRSRKKHKLHSTSSSLSQSSIDFLNDIDLDIIDLYSNDINANNSNSYSSNISYLNETQNDIILNDICNSENELLNQFETHSIYITNNKGKPYINSNKLEKDDVYNVDDNITHIIQDIFQTVDNLCNKKNIIIYILLPNDNTKFVYQFNGFLFNLPNKCYMNLIIILFFDYRILLSSSNNIQNYHNYFVANIEKNNEKKFFKVLNVYCNSSNITTNQIGIYENSTIVNYQFMNLNKLYDYDEIKSLIIERRCSTGKLIQFTGTCWMNANINALLLPKNLRKRMIDQCKLNLLNANKNDKVKYTMNLYDMYKHRNNLKINHIINAIVYNVFIKKRRLKFPTNISEFNDPGRNFMLLLAYKIKREIFQNCENLDEEKRKLCLNKDIRFGNGGGVDINLYVLHNLIQQLYFTSQPNIFRFIKLTNDDNKNTTHINQTINEGESIYKLTSCLISTHQNEHAICGFICEDKQFIYNSNLRNVIESNWSNYDFSNYKNYIINYKNTNLYYEENTTNINIDILIYVLEQKEETELINKEIYQYKTLPNIPCNLINSPLKKCKNTHELINGKCLKKCNKHQTRNERTNRCKKNITKKSK